MTVLVTVTLTRSPCNRVTRLASYTERLQQLSPASNHKMSGATIEYSSTAPTPLKYPGLASHALLPSNEPDYLRLILTSKVYDLIRETPLVPAPSLSKKLGNDIWFKREDLQEVFSFKIRGAYNFMANLPVGDRWKGVVTCSAGKLTRLSR